MWIEGASAPLQKLLLFKFETSHCPKYLINFHQYGQNYTNAAGLSQNMEIKLKKYI